MARWIIQRPQEHSHPAEIRVAEQLRELDDHWTVIWGYYYADRRGTEREGDFLVIGPAGGMLVLEVTTPISPPSGPAPRLLQGPPSKSKFLAATARRRTGSQFRYAPLAASAAGLCFVRAFTDKDLHYLWSLVLEFIWKLGVGNF